MKKIQLSLNFIFKLKEKIANQYSNLIEEEMYFLSNRISINK